MKKLLILLAIVCIGCGDFESESDMFDRFLTELDCPIILIAITDKAEEINTVVVRDNLGRVRTFSRRGGLPQAISFSREIGDTLKPCIK